MKSPVTTDLANDILADAVARTIRDCDGNKPLKCAADPDYDNGEEMIGSAAIATIFDRVRLRRFLISILFTDRFY